MVTRNDAFGGAAQRRQPTPQGRPTATRPNGGASTAVAGEVMEHDALTPFATAGGGTLESITRGEIDIQIATAKRFPRDITTFRKKAETLATYDAETAESCYYTLKRKDRNEAGGQKKIQGPSIRFAEILVACWQNMRVGGTILGEDGRFVSLRGVAWDLESNTAFAVDVKRRITTREGATYSDDMIGVTSNAGVSIAVRNAVLHEIPGAFWKPIYERCLEVARGDAKSLNARRIKVLAFFQEIHKKSAADVYGYLGIKGEADFTLDHLEEMQGLRTALKDGETTLEEAFADVEAAPVPPDPVALIIAETGASPAEAAAIHAGFEALTLTPASRLVQVKKFKGKAADLLQILRDMSGLPLSVETPATPPPPATGQVQERPAQDAAVKVDQVQEREAQRTAPPPPPAQQKPATSSAPAGDKFSF